MQEKERKFKAGDKVNFHPILGDSLCSTGHVITMLKKIGGEDCAFISQVNGQPKSSVLLTQLTFTREEKAEEKPKAAKPKKEKQGPKKKNDAPAKPKKPVEKPRTEIIKGKYRFKEEEKRGMAGSLAQKQIDMILVMEEKKSVMSDYKDRIDRFKWEINRLSRGVHDGFEVRDFECRIVKDYKGHIKKYMDIHTGKEIDRRPLDPSDYQQEMKF